jgi:hypothetical protein
MLSIFAIAIPPDEGGGAVGIEVFERPDAAGVTVAGDQEFRGLATIELARAAVRESF